MSQEFELFGDVKAKILDNKIEVYIPEEHSLAPMIREVGVRRNRDKSAFVIGNTYPGRMEKVVQILEQYKEEFLVVIETGIYGIFSVIQPYEDSGYVVFFNRDSYDKEQKDALKKTIPNISYQALTRTWHVPIENAPELKEFLINANNREGTA